MDSARHILFPPIRHTPVTPRYSLRAHERRVAQHTTCMRMPGAGLWYGKLTTDGSSYAVHARGRAALLGGLGKELGRLLVERAEFMVGFVAR